MKRFLVVLSIVVLVVVAALPAGAKPPPDKPGGGPGDPDPPPPGLVYAHSGGVLWEIATDGLSATPLPCVPFGDLSRGLVGGERYFVWSQTLPEPHPTGYQAAELFAIAYRDAAVEPCVAVQLTDFSVESPASVVVPGTPSWSPDGSQLAFVAFDSAKRDVCPGTPTPDCPEPYEIWVADFDIAAGPTLTNPRILVPEFGATYSPSWSRDGDYLAVAKARDGGGIGILVVDTSSGEVFDVWQGASQLNPAFSPAADRIAYVGPTPRGDSLRREIYVAEFVIDPQTQIPALQAVTQITDKKKMKSADVRFPEWSPDGEHIAFTGEDGGWLTPTRRLYRIAADGSANAVMLSAFDETASFDKPLWRADPSAKP